MRQYTEEVIEYLEYVGYPDFVTFFEPEDVAVAMNKTIALFYGFNLSPRMCALSIVGLTFHYQIATTVQNQVIH
jgi:hypothetical protein